MNSIIDFLRTTSGPVALIHSEVLTLLEEIETLRAKHFRDYLLSLPSDEARWKAIGDLDFCDDCGGDTREHGPCYCRADD